MNDALTDELIDRMLQVNWRGQFATIRTFAPLLKASAKRAFRVDNARWARHSGVNCAVYATSTPERVVRPALA